MELQSQVAIAKQNEEQHMVWGWASVMTKNGQLVTDVQNDQITPEEMQKSVHDFMENSRVGAQLHMYDANDDPIQVGTIVESMVFTKELQDALGIDLGKEGWFVGYHVTNKDVWEDVKKGKLPAFSIGGVAERHPVTKSSGLVEQASAIIRKLDVNKAWTDQARQAAIIARRQVAGMASHSGLAERSAANASNRALDYSEHAVTTDTQRANVNAGKAHYAAARAHEDSKALDSKSLTSYHDTASAAHFDRAYEKGGVSGLANRGPGGHEMNPRFNHFAKAWTEEARNAALIARGAHVNDSLHGKTAFASSETAQAKSVKADKVGTPRAHDDAAEAHTRASRAHAGIGGPDHRGLEDYHGDMAAAHSSYADDLRAK